MFRFGGEQKVERGAGETKRASTQINKFLVTKFLFRFRFARVMPDFMIVNIAICIVCTLRRYSARELCQILVVAIAILLNLFALFI